jgi:acyl dehydratase
LGRSVNPAYLGRTFTLSDPFEVTAPALRAFAHATGTTHPACTEEAAAQALGYRGILAAPTFAAVVAQAAEALYLADPAAGIDFTRVVHASERIEHHRPIIAGDLLYATAHVESIVERSTMATVTTRTHITAADGPVATVTSTLVIRGEDDR